MLLWLTDYVTGGHQIFGLPFYLRAFRYGFRTEQIVFQFDLFYSLLKLLIFTTIPSPKPRYHRHSNFQYRPHRD